MIPIYDRTEIVEKALAMADAASDGPRFAGRGTRLAATLLDGNPTNNFQFVPAQTDSQTKLISVSWRCSRKILGRSR